MCGDAIEYVFMGLCVYLYLLKIPDVKDMNLKVLAF